MKSCNGPRPRRKSGSGLPIPRVVERAAAAAASLVRQFPRLDDGELEAIPLAQELGASFY